jgi:hypothetical protein
LEFAVQRKVFLEVSANKNQKVSMMAMFFAGSK